jgi:hypothetical protein
MRIALCFSGEPRFIDECQPLITSNIIEPNGIEDIFVHTWYDESRSEKQLYSTDVSSFSNEATIKKNCIQRIEELYSPKGILVESPRNFINSSLNWGNSINRYYGGGSKSCTVEEFQKIKINNMYSFMYSNMKSILLKKEYELEHDLIYDMVIRFRFDNIPREKVSIADLDPSLLYYQDMGQPDNMISDWINFSSSRNMDLYSSIFLNIEYLATKSLEKYNAYSPESLIREMCETFSIPTMGKRFGITIPQHGKII